MSLGIKPFIIFALIMISPLGPTHSHADVYTWTDENGTRHFSNITPPQRGESSLMKERLTALFQGEKFKVIKIYDGDTFKARGAGLEFKIRLAGIDTPETGGRNKKGQPFGREATQMLSRLILNKKVRLSQYGTGGYNRILAEVFYQGKNINLGMVQMGLAEVYRGTLPKGFNLSPYQRAQKNARKNQKGIWSQKSHYQSPREWRKKNPWK